MMLEAKKFEQRIKKEEKEEKALIKALSQETGFHVNMDEPNEGEAPKKDKGCGVYLRSMRIMAPLRLHEATQQKLEIALQTAGIEPGRIKANQKTVEEYDNLCMTILTMIELQSYIEKKK